MNKRNDYRSLLKYANEDLEKMGAKIILESEDGAYNLLLAKLDGSKTEEYACGYYEDELADLINDAWAFAGVWANRK